jgi:hypothetical protein
MPAIQVIGNREQFMLSLVFILRVHGERELCSRIGQLNHHSLATLLPGVNKSDTELREIIIMLTKRKLKGLECFQEKVDLYMHQDTVDEQKEESRADRKLVLNGDIPGKQFKGGKQMSRKQLRELARTSFRNNRAVIQNENMLWSKEINKKNREGLG